MEQSSISLRFNRNKRDNILPSDKEHNLLTGLISSLKIGFFIDSLETGTSQEKLHRLLTESPQLKQEAAITEMLSFLCNEGERTSYSILVPYLLTANDKKEAETILRKRFFGIEMFIHRAHNLYQFLEYIRERGIVSIEKEDLKRGILAWDMGELISLARIAYEIGYIDEKTTWKYIRFAGEQCRQTFRNWEEIGKSYLIGQAMTTNKEESADIIINCFHLATQSEDSPWKKNYLSLSTT